MDKMLRLNSLYDFYSELLTDKQRSFFEMHYQHDMSLSEIAELYGISPQGVSDLLKRTEKLLIGYEEKLALSYKHNRLKEQVAAITHMLDNMDNRGSLPEITGLIREKVLEILN